MLGVAIDWSAFDWPSFATLATGGMAVFAAYRVGQKQVAIQNRQTDIQEAALKSELFDRRLDNYETVRGLMNSLLRNPDEIDRDLEQRFFTAQREAQFLFSQKYTTN